MTTPLPANTHCIGCNYDLAGLTESAVCPECALPCTETVEHLQSLGDRANPIKRIYNGLGSVRDAHALFLFAVVLAMLGFYIEQRSPLAAAITGLLIIFAIIAAVICGVLGTAEITTPFARHSKTPSRSVHQQVIQFLIALGLLWNLVLFPCLFVYTEPIVGAVFFYTWVFLPSSMAYATAGTMGDVAGHIAMSRLLRLAAVIVGLSALSTAVMHHMSIASANGKSAGLGASTWREYSVYAIVATLVVHLATTLLFRHKLKKQLKNLTPPPAPTTTP